jgi:hypothetical protein
VYTPLATPGRLQNLLERAIAQFRIKDSVLLRRNQVHGGVHERTVAHRLAFYLELELRADKVPGSVSVDCEYNRFGQDPKILSEMESFRKIIEAADRNLTSRGELSILPDIIVHERGEKGTNYLVVELKKKSNSNPDSLRLDQLKLSRLTADDCEYHYILGAEVLAVDLPDESKQDLSIVAYWQHGQRHSVP